MSDYHLLVNEERAGRTVRPNAPVKNPRALHGTRARYVAGCSGPLCRAANTAYINTQRAKARNGTGAAPKDSA